MTTRYAERKKRYWGAPVPPHLKHGAGSYAGQIYGCDCPACLPSGRRYSGKPTPPIDRQRRSREKLRGKPVPPGVKHGIYTYQFYRCRCPKCQEAASIRRHRQRNPWMYRPTYGRWREENGVTTLCWPPAGAGPDWQCECTESEAVS